MSGKERKKAEGEEEWQKESKALLRVFVVGVTLGGSSRFAFTACSRRGSTADSLLSQEPTYTWPLAPIAGLDLTSESRLYVHSACLRPQAVPHAVSLEVVADSVGGGAL